MLPQVFLERMQGLLGSEYEEFLVSFDHEKYQALRLNPLKLRTESGRTDDSTVIDRKNTADLSFASGSLGGQRLLLHKRGPARKASLA